MVCRIVYAAWAFVVGGVPGEVPVGIQPNCPKYNGKPNDHDPFH